MIEPAKVRDRQRRSAASLIDGAPHFTRETGSSPPSAGGSDAGVERFLIVDLDDPAYPERPKTSGDWLICRPWSGGTIRPRVQSPGRCDIASGGLMTRAETDWVALGVQDSDRVQITDAQENGDPVPDADKTYEITSVTASTITLTGWVPTGDVDANFKVGPDTVLVAKPEPLRRTPHDTVAVERVESPPLGNITGSSLTAGGVDWLANNVVDTDRVQIYDATQENAEGETVELAADTFDIASVSAGSIELSNWPHGAFPTECKFRVGPPGRRSPRNGIEYRYDDHTTRTGKVIVEEGEDPGAMERQQITAPWVVGDEIYATPVTVVEHADDPDSALLLAVTDTRAWAQRDA